MQEVTFVRLEEKISLAIGSSLVLAKTICYTSACLYTKSSDSSALWVTDRRASTVVDQLINLSEELCSLIIFNLTKTLYHGFG